MHPRRYCIRSAIWTLQTRVLRVNTEGREILLRWVVKKSTLNKVTLAAKLAER